MRHSLLLVAVLSIVVAITSCAGSNNSTPPPPPALSEIVYTIPQDGNNTHAYSVDTTTAKVHEQPGSPFNLGAVDNSSPDTPFIIGSTPNGAFLLIEKRRLAANTSSIYVAKADANGIPVFPATDSRNYGQAGLESLISPSGKFVYVHEFDQFNTISVFALDANGKLTKTGSIQLGETFGPPGPIYSFGTVTADNSTLILISFAGHTCSSMAVYRLAINQQTGVPSAFDPANWAWQTSTCSDTPYHSSFSELLAVDSAAAVSNNPPVPMMKAHPFDGVRYTAGATCDSSVKPVCQSLTFEVVPRSSFIVIGDASGMWHSLDKSLNDTASTVVLPTDVDPQFSADGRLMLIIRNDIHMALFDPATGAFKTVTATISGPFETWSVISVQL